MERYFQISFHALVLTAFIALAGDRTARHPVDRPVPDLFRDHRKTERSGAARPS